LVLVDMPDLISLLNSTLIRKESQTKMYRSKQN